MALTIKQIQNAKPGRYSDGHGLYLLVSPNRSKSWVLRVMHKGRRRDFGLGSVVFEPIGPTIPLSKKKAITLAEAREKAREGRQIAKAGLNPSIVWKVEEVVIPTFETAAREYHGKIAKGWKNGKHKDQWINTLELYAFPKIGKLPVNEIDAAAIERVLLPIWLEVGETARRVKQRIAAVLDYSHAQGWRETDAPIRSVNKLMGGIKQAKRGHFDAMPHKDLPAFMSALTAAEFSVGRKALQFLILTLPRSGELRAAKLREFDLDAEEWRIPAENTKTGEVHIVPLVPEAVAIVREMRDLFGLGPDGVVFPGNKGKPMSDATLAKVLRVNGGFGTVHGLRSTFTDWASETGFNKDWIEAALAHTIAGREGKTVAAYKRTTFFDQRRAKLMPAWASYALGNSNNVVQLVASA